MRCACRSLKSQQRGACPSVSSRAVLVLVDILPPSYGRVVSVEGPENRVFGRCGLQGFAEIRSGSLVFFKC